MTAFTCTGRHDDASFGQPTDPGAQYRDEPWFALCEQFVREVFARPKHR